DTRGTIPLNGTGKGISFLNASTGWMTAYAGGLTNFFWLYVTRDGGATWHHQALPRPPGETAAEFALVPPVFFNANDGIMTVSVGTMSGDPYVEVYVTHNGGETWQSTTPAPRFIGVWLYTFVDVNDGWIGNPDTLYSTPDGGQ